MEDRTKKAAPYLGELEVLRGIAIFFLFPGLRFFLRYGIPFKIILFYKDRLNKILPPYLFFSIPDAEGYEFYIPALLEGNNPKFLYKVDNF